MPKVSLSTIIFINGWVFPLSMIENCHWCGGELTKEICCKDRRLRNNLVDSSIFLEAYDETTDSNNCRLILDAAREKIFMGNINILILGEIYKKLLKFKKDVEYRFDSIYERIVSDLLNFKILYLCEDTIKKYLEIKVRGGGKSHDKLNLSCAIENNCSLFILKDKEFTINYKTSPTHLVQITNKNDLRLVTILNEIKALQAPHS